MWGPQLVYVALSLAECKAFTGLADSVLCAGCGAIHCGLWVPISSGACRIVSGNDDPHFVLGVHGFS